MRTIIVAFQVPDGLDLDYIQTGDYCAIRVDTDDIEEMHHGVVKEAEHQQDFVRKYGGYRNLPKADGQPYFDHNELMRGSTIPVSGDPVRGDLEQSLGIPADLVKPEGITAFEVHVPHPEAPKQLPDNSY